MKTSTTEQEVMLLICAAQLLQSIPSASGALRKKLVNRAERLIEEAEELRVHAELVADKPAPFVPALEQYSYDPHNGPLTQPEG